MEDLDTRVLKACAQLLKDGEQPLLVTVARTWGSSPRPPGALMVMSASGITVGSVSGGCIEDDLIHQIRTQGRDSLCPHAKPQVLRYGIDEDRAHSFGLPCGGTIELVLEPIGPHSQIEVLLAALAARQVVQRVLDLQSGQVTLQSTDATDHLPTLNEQQLITVVGPRHRLLLIGAGDLSAFLCTMAAGLGFEITVCDPRPEHRMSWHDPHAQLVHDMPDDVVLAMKPDERTAIVTLTHDPKIDDLALMEALRTPAFYVGAIGSRVNNQRRRERLHEHFDVSEAQLMKLRGPAGVYIGSKTPHEIALSIMAEVIAAKNGVALTPQMDVAQAKNHLAAGADSLPSSCGIKGA